MVNLAAGNPYLQPSCEIGILRYFGKFVIPLILVGNTEQMIALYFYSVCQCRVETYMCGGINVGKFEEK